MDTNPHYRGGLQGADPSSPSGDEPMTNDPSQAVVYRHRVSYLYNEQPRSQELEYEQPQIPPEVVALRLLEIHYGDGENSLLMPAADDSPQEVMNQAQLMGISMIEIQSHGRVINDVSE